MKSFFTLSFFLFVFSVSNAQITYKTIEKPMLPAKLFLPVTVNFMSGKAVKGWATPPGYSNLPFRFISDSTKMKSGYVLQKDWRKTFKNDTIKTLVFHLKDKDYLLERVLIPIISDYEMMHKVYENDHAKLYTTFLEHYFSPGEYSKIRNDLANKNVSVDYMLKLNKDKPKYVFYRYRNINENKPPKSLLRRLRKCKVVEKRVKSGEFGASFEDLTKILDAFSENCGVD